MQVKFQICIALFPAPSFSLTFFHPISSEFLISLLKAKYSCTVANYNLDLPPCSHNH